MKKESFILDFLKSGAFLLLLILALLILLGIAIADKHKDTVQMKEDVLYVAPKPKR
jgi:hypothetical protein